MAFLLWLQRLLAPREVFLIYNEEEYVGSFLQGVVYSPVEAFDYIQRFIRLQEREAEEMKRVLQEAGTWDEAYDGNRKYDLYVVMYNVKRRRSIGRVHEIVENNKRTYHVEEL